MNAYRAKVYQIIDTELFVSAYKCHPSGQSPLAKSSNITACTFSSKKWSEGEDS